MQSSVFQSFDKEILSPLVDRQKQKYPTISFAENWRDHVFTYYESNREFVRAQMRKHGKQPFLMDRHKIAACMIWAILKVKPLRVPGEIKTINARLSNEIVAFSAAVAIVESFRCTDNAERGFSKPDQSLALFHFPKTDEGEKYRHHVYQAMYQAIEHDKFEPMVWANLMFVLEKYNILYHRQTAQKVT